MTSRKYKCKCKSLTLSIGFLHIDVLNYYLHLLTQHNIDFSMVPI
jgi:hypothetical protein